MFYIEVIMINLEKFGELVVGKQISFIVGDITNQYRGIVIRVEERAYRQLFPSLDVFVDVNTSNFYYLRLFQANGRWFFYFKRSIKDEEAICGEPIFDGACPLVSIAHMHM